MPEVQSNQEPKATCYMTHDKKKDLKSLLKIPIIFVFRLFFCNLNISTSYNWNETIIELSTYYVSQCYVIVVIGSEYSSFEACKLHVQSS